MSAMDTSITTTSGTSSHAARQASPPPAASPTTCMSACALTSDFNPSRTTMWSSARKTRILSTLTSSLPAARVEGYAHEERRARSVRGLNVDSPAEQRRALTHPEQPEPAAPARRLPRRLNVEPAAVVLDDGEDVVAAPLKDEAHAVGPGMFGDVRERLLRDAVEGRLVCERQAAAAEARAVKVNGHARALRPLLDVVV